MSKQCKQCNQEKELTDFPFSNKVEQKYRTTCKDCYSSNRKERYLKRSNDEILDSKNKRSEYYNINKETIINDVIIYQKKNKEKYRKWQEKYRKKLQDEWKLFKDTLECLLCNENNGCCLDFHHVDDNDKEFNITNIYKNKNKLKKELNKCVVLCANCHRKLHSNKLTQTEINKTYENVGKIKYI